MAKSVRLITVERKGMKASPVARNHKFFVVALPENACERDQVATRPTKTPASLIFRPARRSSIYLSPFFSKDDPGDTKIISVCRVSKANDGGVGGCKSISRGTESQVFRGRAAGKRMKTRSRRDKANEKPCLVDFSTSEGIVNLPQAVFLGSMLIRRWQ